MVRFAPIALVRGKGQREVCIAVQNFYPHQQIFQRFIDQNVIKNLGDALIHIGVPFFRRQRIKNAAESPFLQGFQRERFVIRV